MVCPGFGVLLLDFFFRLTALSIMNKISSFERVLIQLAFRDIHFTAKLNQSRPCDDASDNFYNTFEIF